MKRKFVLLISVAILIVAAYATFCLTHRSNGFEESPINPDFMYGDCLYTPRQQLAVECEGDTDLLRVTDVSRATVNNGLLYLGVFLNDDHPDLAVTYDQVVDGRRQTEDRWIAAAVERQVGGRWDSCSVVVGVGAALPSYDPLPYATLAAGESRTVISLPVDALPGGYYRFTLYFFELDDRVYNGIRDTKGERRSVSFVAYIPDTSYKPYEVSAVRVSVSDGGQGGFSVVVTPTIKSNEGTLYLDSTAVELEKRTDNGWETQEGAVRPDDADALGRWRDATALREPIKLDVESLDGDYRLVLRFAENADGSGEQYTLTLRLKFDE